MADHTGDPLFGQDDLIKDDGVAESLARKAKKLPKALSGNDSSIYTNRDAPTPDEVITRAERQQEAAVRGTSSGSFTEKLKALFTRR